jgi:ribosomal-protein-alanine acetyltransferase
VLIIRNAKPDDMFSIIKLASETLTEQYNPILFNHLYEAYPQGFWIAEKNHKIIGFIIGVKTNPYISRILMIGISEKNRNQGLGSILLFNLLKELSLNDIKQVLLEVRKNNKKAIKFYQKHGFDIIDTINKFYKNEENAYIMKKNI